MSVAPLRDQLQELLAAVRVRTGVPGLGVAVSVRGERIHACAGTRWADDAAPLGADDRFELACVSKLLTALVTLELAGRGELGLEAALGEYLGELRGTPYGDGIRVAHLLCHTGGYPGLDGSSAAACTWERLVRHLRAAPPFFQPGRVFSYEPADSALLGEVLRRVTGKDASRLVTEMILDPLALSPANGRGCHAGRHAFDLRARRFERAREAPVQSAFWRASSPEVALSLPALLTLADAVMRPGEGVQGRANTVSPAAALQLRRPAVRLPPAVRGPLAGLMPEGFGLGAAAFPGGVSGHGGIGHGQCAALAFDAEAQIGVAVGLNAVLPRVRDLILAAVFRALKGASLVRPAEPLGFELGELEGVYRGAGRCTLRVALEGGRLACRTGTDGQAAEVSARLRIDGNTPVLDDAPPHLSLAFFRAGEGVGVLVGLRAFKRTGTHVPPSARRQGS